MIWRIWIAVAVLVPALAWVLMVLFSPPNSTIAATAIEGYRAQTLIPAADTLRVSEKVGHEVFEVPTSDAEHLRAARAAAEAMATGTEGKAATTPPPEGEKHGHEAKTEAHADQHGAAPVERHEESSPAEMAAHGDEGGHGRGGEAVGLSILAEGQAEVATVTATLPITKTVDLSMHEWGYEPNHVMVAPGDVIHLRVRHAGKSPHEFMLMTGPAMTALDYRLERADWNLMEHEAIFEKPILLPGDTFEVIMKVHKAGAWMYMCMFPYHMQLGMMGMIMTPGVSMAGMGHAGHAMPAPTAAIFEGKGSVVAVVPEGKQIVLDHEAIEGFMAAMTMGYAVASDDLLQGLNPGDTVKFKIDAARQQIIAVERLNH